jgi:hypothetical protein
MLRGASSFFVEPGMARTKKWTSRSLARRKATGVPEKRVVRPTAPTGVPEECVPAADVKEWDQPPERETSSQQTPRRRETAVSRQESARDSEALAIQRKF